VIVYEVETIRMVPLSTLLLEGTGQVGMAENPNSLIKNGKVLIRTSNGYWISPMLFWWAIVFAVFDSVIRWKILEKYLLGGFLLNHNITHSNTFWEKQWDNLQEPQDIFVQPIRLLRKTFSNSLQYWSRLWRIRRFILGLYLRTNR
jgi:hypothetical protein